MIGRRRRYWMSADHFSSPQARSDDTRSDEQLTRDLGRTPPIRPEQRGDAGGGLGHHETAPARGSAMTCQRPVSELSVVDVDGGHGALRCRDRMRA